MCPAQSDSRILQAFINDQMVGTLRDDNGQYSFTYATHWLSYSLNFPISPHLALQSSPHVDNSNQRHVQRYFENLLHKDGHRTLPASETKPVQSDLISLLTYYGVQWAGSPILLPEGANAKEPGEGLICLDDHALQQRGAQQARMLEVDGTNKCMSITGGQHRFAVVLTEDEITESRGCTVSTHSLNFDHNSSAFPQLVINQWFIMQLAKRLTIEILDTTRRYIPAAVCITERFDRQASDGTVKRLHSIDACQLLGMDASYITGQGSIRNLGDIAQACRNKAATRTRLYSWLVFNVLTGNTVACLKNLNFIIDHEGIKLAPFYDLLCTAVYESGAFGGSTWPEQTRLALSLPDVEYVSQINRDIMITVGQELGLKTVTAARLLDYQLDRISAAADVIYEDVLATSEQQSAKAVNHGLRMQAEYRCVRCIIHDVIKPMVRQIGQ